MWKPRSLVGRVALSVALGSLLSGTIVALVTGLLANRLARHQQDSHLENAAGVLAFELLVKGYDPHYAAADEAQELAHTGIVVAIFEAGRFLAGDSTVPFVAPGTCVDAPHARACAASAGRWVTVAARDGILMRSHAEVTTTAAIIALVLTISISSGVALALAYAAVKPLDNLANAVRRVPADARREASLGDDAGVVEVDALRSSLRSAFAQLRDALTRSRSFVGDAAHQLRTPLATILGELDLAIEATGPAGREETKRARQVAARLSTLVDRLLVLANPDEDLRASTTVSLLDVVEDALDALSESARARVECEGSVALLRADPALLSTAIVSALEVSLERSLGRVRVEVRARGDLAVLVITGEGSQATVPAKPLGPTDRELWLEVVARVTSRHGGRSTHLEDRAGGRIELCFPRVDE